MVLSSIEVEQVLSSNPDNVETGLSLGDDRVVVGGAWRNHPTYGEFFIGFANAVVVVVEEEDENTGDNNKNNPDFVGTECSVVSDAAIEWKLVGGECRKEPT